MRRRVARVVRLPSGVARRAAVAARTRNWEPYSHLFVVGDRIGWSIDDDAVQLQRTAARLGVPVAPAAWAVHARRQAVFLPSHFSALQPRWLGSTHRLGLSYFHGRPGTPGHPEFDVALTSLRANAARIDRIQVTHAEMHELVVSAGVDERRVFRIPIGIDLECFPLGDPAARAAARAALDLPPSAFVVGSFQKDGVGWGEGLEPKPVKGPDVLVDVLARVHERADDLVVLLTGPARGWVRRELDRRAIPYRHVHLARRGDLVTAYHALDVHVVASRQEGGPKSVLESLATGAALVATRVGQVPEIVADGVTALLADVEDAAGLAAQVMRIRDGGAFVAELRRAGRERSESFAYESLDGSWAALCDGFVERGAVPSYDGSARTSAHRSAIDRANDA
jgi:glycosyltransferase involved in cell wall biosynthesis